MRIIIRTVLLCIFISFSSTALSDTPEKLTEQYYQYIKNSDWESLANMMHDNALKEFKQSLLPMFEQEATRKQSMLLERIYGKGATLDQARNSTDKIFFQQSIKNVVGLLRNTTYKVRDTRVLGNVAEGTDTVHVMVKETTTTGSHDTNTIEVFTFRNNKDGWKLMLSGKLANFVQTARFSTEQAK